MMIHALKEKYYFLWGKTAGGLFLLGQSKKGSLEVPPKGSPPEEKQPHGVWRTAHLAEGTAWAKALRRERVECAERRGHPPRNIESQRKSREKRWRLAKDQLTRASWQNSKDESPYILITAAYRELYKTLCINLSALKKSGDISVEKRPFDFVWRVSLATFSNAIFRQW